MVREKRGSDRGLWLRLIGFALIPVTVQAFQPAVGGSLGILAPLPLAYGLSRRGIGEGVAAVGFVALVTGAVTGIAQGIYFLVETLPLCVGIWWTVGARRSLHGSVVRGVALVALSALAAAVIYGVATRTPPAEIYQETVQQMGLFMEDVTSGPALEPELQQQVDWLVSIWKRLFLGIWLATLVLLVLFYAMLIRGWMMAAGVLKPEGLALLTRWRMPFPYVGAFVAVASTVLIAEGLVRDVALNALLPLGTLYGIQGMVIAGHMFTRWALPSFFRILILAFCIISIPLVTMIVVSLGGLFDTWIDFRRRWPIEPPPQPST